MSPLRSFLVLLLAACLLPVATSAQAPDRPDDPRALMRQLAHPAPASTLEAGKRSDAADYRLAADTLYDRNGDDWVEATFSRYLYDEVGRIVRHSTFADIPGFGEIEVSRTLFNYPEGVIERIRQMQVGIGNLQNTQRERIAFDAEGRLSTYESASWDGGSWEPEWRDSYTYDAAGRLTEILEEARDEGAWRNDELSVVTYSDEDVTQTDRDWDGSQWVNDERYIVGGIDAATATNLFQLSQQLYFTPGGFAFDNGGAWLGDFELLFAAEVLEQYWDGTAWVNDGRTRVETDASERPVRLFDDEWEDDAWVPEYRLDFGYEDGLLVTRDEFEWRDDAWVLDVALRSRYDGRGVPVEFIIADDDVDEDGSLDDQARIVLIYEEATSTAAEPVAVEGVLRFEGAAPHPFHTTTHLRFTLDAPGVVRLAVYDLVGREVAVLVDGPMLAGRHAVPFDAAHLASGLYVARLEAAGRAATRPLVRLR